MCDVHTVVDLAYGCAGGIDHMLGGNKVNLSMTIFVIFNVSNPQSLKVAIERVFPNDHLSLGASEWLVSSASMTSRDVGDAIEISEGKNGTAIIMAMAGYWGRASNNIWEWIAAKGKTL